MPSEQVNAKNKDFFLPYLSAVEKPMFTLFMSDSNAGSSDLLSISLTIL